MKHTLTLFTALLLAPLAELHAADAPSDGDSTMEERMEHRLSAGGIISLRTG